MTNVSDPAAKVYAQALIEVAEELKCLGPVYDDLQALRALYDGNADFRLLFTSPRIDREDKWAAIRETFEGKVVKPVLGLLHILIVKGREMLLDNVVDQFLRIKDQHEHRVHAYVTVAQPLDDEFRAELKKRLEGSSGDEIVIHETVDPAALGGAAIRIGDKVIDRTLRTRLSALRHHLLETAEGPTR